MTEETLTSDDVARMFTRAGGDYVFARWGRPIVPVVFGVDAATLATVKGAIEAVVALSGHKMAETDPELGANLMVFFFRDWQELLEVPNLDQLVEGLSDTVNRLDDAGANQIVRSASIGTGRSAPVLPSSAWIPRSTRPRPIRSRCRLRCRSSCFGGIGPSRGIRRLRRRAG